MRADSQLRCVGMPQVLNSRMHQREKNSTTNWDVYVQTKGETIIFIYMYTLMHLEMMK